MHESESHLAPCKNLEPTETCRAPMMVAEAMFICLQFLCTSYFPFFKSVTITSIPKVTAHSSENFITGFAGLGLENLGREQLRSWGGWCKSK